MCLTIPKKGHNEALRALRNGKGAVITAYKELTRKTFGRLISTVEAHPYQPGWNRPNPGGYYGNIKRPLFNKDGFYVHGGALHLYVRRKKVVNIWNCLVPVAVLRKDILAVGRDMGTRTIAVRKCYIAPCDYRAAIK